MGQAIVIDDLHVALVPRIDGSETTWVVFGTARCAAIGQDSRGGVLTCGPRSFDHRHTGVVGHGSGGWAR